MKRIYVVVLLVLLCFFNVHVYALDYDLEITQNGDKYSLIVIVGQKTYSYAEVIEKYDLDPYIKFYYMDHILYFYNGLEIDEISYNKGVAEFEADRRCEEIKDVCKRVHNTTEMINVLDEIYREKSTNIYQLVYSDYEYANNIDFYVVEEHIKNNYIHEVNKNMYKYDEYAYYGAIKYMPTYNETEMIVDFFDIKISKKEEEAVNQFLEYFLPLLENKSDYEKILGVYTYLSNTSIYIEDDGYTYFIDAKLSAYDVLLKKEHVCIGMATTFQLLMEKLNIESYIVDDVYVSDEIIGSIHTYNVVKFNDKWYVVDVLSNSMAGFLISDRDYDNHYYYDIEVSRVSFFEENLNVAKNYEFDYQKIDYVITSILTNKKKVEKLEVQKKDIKELNDWTYIVLICILITIAVVIVIFSRNKGKKIDV